MTTETLQTVAVDTAPATRESAPSFVRDMNAFQRIYRASRAAWRAGENPLTPYFTTDSMATRKFGLEIEFNSDDMLVVDDEYGYDTCYCGCCDCGNASDFCDGCSGGECVCECYCERDGAGNLTPVGEWLYDNGYTHVPEGEEYHATVDYDIWRYESDCTVTGGEVITPILDGRGASWVNVQKVMSAIRRLGGESNSRNCGGHVNINVDDFTETDYRRLIALASVFEDVMYRLATNPHRARLASEGSASRHRGQANASSLFGRYTREPSFTSLQNLNFALGRDKWMHADVYSNRLEFRIFDGTLDEAMSQTFVMIASAFADAAKREETDAVIERMERRAYGWHVQQRRDGGNQPRSALSGRAWKQDTLAIREFVDLLFDDMQDKERVITLFAANDWNYAR